MEIPPTDRAPIRRRWSFRIQGVMLVITAVALSLALLRVELSSTMPIVIVLGTIWLVDRGVARWVADSTGKPPSQVTRALLLLGSIWIGLLSSIMVLVLRFWHFD